ncbi:hypothetical protein [Kitasatospora sp. NA04385]|uniref:hypothetical protein n=1 Tax=Kitasatospora sp. NA04385 TaxID=2742135 RepID=UPI0020CB087E|nr:hypothetical protein [Kitasatospora sp. NA04385]
MLGGLLLRRAGVVGRADTVAPAPDPPPVPAPGVGLGSGSGVGLGAAAEGGGGPLGETGGVVPAGGDEATEGS